MGNEYGLLWLAIVGVASASEPALARDRGEVSFESVGSAQYRFDGVLGPRIAANEANWLLCAPQANPGMLEMFRVRDRQPAPQLVPWAGEFVGKYLLSAVESLALSDTPALRSQVTGVVADFIATQSPEGYLGPFPRSERLLGHWDLWGHYHAIQALLAWHAASGDGAALDAARKAGDLVCQTYLGTGRRAFDAGDHEMNLAVIHGLGELYRVTGEARYLDMAREVEKDWERAGDYLRAGLSGIEFFESPRPRWESLHDLQGLLTMHRITGDERYRTAFEHHWRSIRRFDRRNTGAFSSGEQATGNPYTPSAIETCCTIAWMALTLDQLRLSGEATVADEFELSLFNAAAGAQHPSGRWWTYNTPMDGTREASAHTIVFQARAGTPEMNCCSVNGPRGLGLLSEWAVMRAADGWVVNNYAPGRFSGRDAAGKTLALTWESEYPIEGRVRLRVEPTEPREFTLHLRIPGWSARTTVAVNDEALPAPRPGMYLTIRRTWHAGDRIDLGFDFGLRFAVGDREAAGKVSLYRGPLLLAYDQHHNGFDEDRLPAIPLDSLNEARRVGVKASSTGPGAPLAPWILIDLPVAGGPDLRLCDYASAGATGTRYRSWLAPRDCPPSPPVSQRPLDGVAVGPGKTLFRWQGARGTNTALTRYQIEWAPTPDFANVAARLEGLNRNAVLVGDDVKGRLPTTGWIYWRVVAKDTKGTTPSVGPASRFRLDGSLPRVEETVPELRLGPQGEVVRAALLGSGEPEIGRLESAVGLTTTTGPAGAAAGAIELNGQRSMLVYAVPEFPDEAFTVSVRVCVRQWPPGRIGQVLSAWAAGMDDPLRLTVDRGQLSARVEAGQGHTTPGVAITTNRWYHVAAVRDRGDLRLYLDGQEKVRASVPSSVVTTSKRVGLGGNPRFGGDESLAAAFAGFTFYGRALDAAEVAALARGTVTAAPAVGSPPR
jgi:DUF1680 family protein